MRISPSLRAFTPPPTLETVAQLEPVHTGLVVLVDGDSEGDKYVKSLQEASRKPRMIIQWPQGWDIEEVVAHIVEADGEALLPEISALTELEIADMDSFRKKLRVPGKDGIKKDYLKYELISGAIRSSSRSTHRLRLIMTALRRICVDCDERNHMFEKDASRSEADCPVFVFKPESQLEKIVDQVSEESPSAFI